MNELGKQSGAVFSMTGFGAAMVTAADRTCRVEIRSVNHRGRKFTVRSRPPLGTHEKSLRDLLDETLRRGAVDVYVTLTRTLDESGLTICADKARTAVATIRHLATELGLDGDLTARDLLLVPGLLESATDEPVSAAEWPTVAAAVKSALKQVREMRRAEGAATVTRLREWGQQLEAFESTVRQQAPGVVVRTQERLRARIAELHSEGIDQNDERALERTLCLFADRVDINEELDRLASHCAQFRSALADGGEVGKHIEFIAQELLREINTLAAKANDAKIISAAVMAKLAVEKIKEQAANLE